jgi:hypothetical protein
MLNLHVAMFTKQEGLILVLTISLTWLVSLAQALPGRNFGEGLFDSHGFQSIAAYQQATPTPGAEGQETGISSPVGGEALQGAVPVMGTIQAVGLVSYEVAFAYQSDSTQTWFLIGQGETPVEQGPLANWDTSTISDGTYRLRLLMILGDGRVRESIVEGVRVRNYSPVETATPTAPGEVVVERATPTATATALPDFVIPERTLAPLATNAVQIDGGSLAQSAGLGMALVAGAIGIGGLYFGLKALLRRL